MVQKFKKKPVVIEAMQWVPDSVGKTMEMIHWLETNGVHYKMFDDDTIGLGTLESGDGLDRHRGKPNDWVIRGIKGEFYVCDLDVFEQSYDSE